LLAEVSLYMKLAHNVVNQKHGKGRVIYGIKTKKAIIWTDYYSSEIGGTPQGLWECRSSKTWRCGVFHQ